MLRVENWFASAIIILIFGIVLFGVSKVFAYGSEEVLIFRPDGTAEYCITYSDGTVYCR